MWSSPILQLQRFNAEFQPNLESEREVKHEVKNETDVFSEHMADSIATGGIFDMDDFNLNAEFNLINDFDLPTNF